MDDKTDVQGEWSTEAIALLDSLAVDPSKARAAKSNKRRATSRQPVSETSPHHSQNSQAGQSAALGMPWASGSSQEHSNMSQASLSPGQPDNNRHHPHSQSENGDTEMVEAQMLARKTADPLPFGAGQWQGCPAGPSMDDPADNAWEAPDDAPQVPPNKRRRTQEDGPTAFARAFSKKQQREAPVARFTQVSPTPRHWPAAVQSAKPEPFVPCTSVVHVGVVSVVLLTIRACHKHHCDTLMWHAEQQSLSLPIP